MKTTTSGGAPQNIGPPAFGRLNDIHIHKNGVGPAGNPDISQALIIRQATVQTVTHL